MTKNVFLTIDVGSKTVGKLELVLYDTIVPKTVDNFVALLPRYKKCGFHRIIPGFMAQGGDFTKGDGTAGESIFGETFADENFLQSHTTRGQLSMANAGPNTNGSQFFVTFRPVPHLDGKHVVFGHVDLAKSAGVLDAMEHVRTGKNDVPRVPVTISDCGVVKAEKETANDEDEIDLDATDEPNPAEDDKDTTKTGPPKANENDEIELPEEDEEEEEEADDGAPKSKSKKLRDRLKKLKMKMNQARQLNRQEVMREGERLGSEEGKAKERKRQAAHDKKLRQKEWESRNAKAVEVAAAAGIDAKFMVEPAADSISKSIRKADKANDTRYAVNDYYNSEGQHRNYQRNLKSLPSHAGTMERSSVDSSSTFNPGMALTTEKEQADEQRGARRLATELQKRAEKAAKKRDRVEFEGEDVSYINQRNKRFNEKINRNYDQHTAEIRQNLERGTAL